MSLAADLSVHEAVVPGSQLLVSPPRRVHLDRGIGVAVNHSGWDLYASQLLLPTHGTDRSRDLPGASGRIESPVEEQSCAFANMGVVNFHRISTQYSAYRNGMLDVLLAPFIFG